VSKTKKDTSQVVSESLEGGGSEEGKITQKRKDTSHVVDQSLEGRGIEENIQDRKETSQWWVDEFIYFLECLRFKL